MMSSLLIIIEYTMFVFQHNHDEEKQIRRVIIIILFVYFISLSDDE